MKGWKEYLVLFVLIAALGSYLYFRHTDQVNYQLPRLAAVNSKEITRIVITGPDSGVTLARKDGSWLIEAGSLPADRVKAEKILDRVAGLKLTDLVSESGNYSRYDLDEKNRITVSAHAGGNLVRKFVIGKTAPSSRHTYVMVEGNGNVYQARDSFRDDFTADPDTLRDRRVLTFVQDEISRVIIARSGSPAVTITRGESPSKTSGQEEGQQPPAMRWTDSAGHEVPSTEVMSLVSSLSNLECGRFLDDRNKDRMGIPEVTITMSGSRDYTLSLFPREGEAVPAVSSASPSAFTLPEYRQEGLLRNIDMLSGGKQQEVE